MFLCVFVSLWPEGLIYFILFLGVGKKSFHFDMKVQQKNLLREMCSDFISLFKHVQGFIGDKCVDLWLKKGLVAWLFKTTDFFSAFLISIGFFSLLEMKISLANSLNKWVSTDH